MIKNICDIIIILFILCVLYIIIMNLLFCNEYFTEEKKKLAFCFLIYDEINHEDLWYKFFKNIDKNKYNIYIHYKYQKKLKYFEEYKLDKCIDTKYADISLTKAQNILFRKAYEDIENYKFIMISNSCIPLKSFNYIYKQLINDNKGYLNEANELNIPKNAKYLINYFDYDTIGYSHQWIILNRKLVNKLAFIDDNTLDLYFKDVFAPEEYYYYTYIKLLKLENELYITKNISNDATTFTQWNDVYYKYKDDNNKGLKNYNLISKEEMDYLLNSKSLFGRKFNIICNVIDNDKLININDYINYD